MATVEIADQIATITIADGAKLSQHSRSEGDVLRDAIQMCGDRDDVKVIVLRSTGANFCPAVDQAKTWPDASVPSWWNEIYTSSNGLYQSLCFSKKITITAIRGECAGAGSLLVLCSDLTVADSGAVFQSPFQMLPEANFVLAALTMRLNRVKSWMLGGASLTASAALDAGLINRIAKTNVLDEANALAKSAARMPLDAIAMSKLMIETCLDAQGVGQDFDMTGFYAASAPLLGGFSRANSS